MLTLIPPNKLNLPPQSTILRDFQNYNSEVPEKMGRRVLATEKRYALQANAVR